MIDGQDIAGFEVEKGDAGNAFMPHDNLTIVLCSYFAKHCDRPEGDEAGECEDNHYWGDWVCQKTDKALNLLAKQINDLVSTRRQNA